MEGAIQLPEFNLSNYALGYAYFQRKEKICKVKKKQEKCIKRMNYLEFIYARLI